MVKTNGGAPGGVLTVTVTIQVPTIPWLSACARALARKAASDKTMLAIPNANFLIDLAPLVCSTVSGCLLGGHLASRERIRSINQRVPGSQIATLASPDGGVARWGQAVGHSGMRSWLSISGLWDSYPVEASPACATVADPETNLDRVLCRAPRGATVVFPAPHPRSKASACQPGCVPPEQRVLKLLLPETGMSSES